jgi:hypothetical protein
MSFINAQRRLTWLAVVAVALAIPEARAAEQALDANASQPNEVAAASPRFGIGAAATLSGASGLSLRYFATPKIGAELVLRVDLQDIGRDWVAVSFIAGARGELVVRGSDKGRLSAFAGARLIQAGASSLGFEAGLRGEYFLWSGMSVFAEAGCSLKVRFHQGAELGIGGLPLAAAGFTFWFL